jgi:site-specific DNA-methyltransferase (adenine-specific)
MNNIVHLIDNMEFMKGIPDKYFELAIVDPPYFNGPEKLGYYGNVRSKTKVKRQSYNIIGKWNIPTQRYYDELVRISVNQIIWGINYFNFAHASSGRIIWDKRNDKSTFSDGEIASCSLIETVRFFRFMWNGMLQENMKNKEFRIHPTQKPVALYKWLLKNYAKPNDKIFDSHVGSGSSRIACYDMGFDFTGCEIDLDYWKAQEERFEQYTMQGDLFSGQDLQGLMLGGSK